MNQGMENEDQKASIQTEADQIELMAQLEREKEQLASQGLYLEAENIRLKIKELTNNIYGQQKQGLQEQHLVEMQNLDESLKKTISEYNIVWEEKFNAFEEKAKILEKNLTEKHLKEMENAMIELDKKLSKFVKFSKEYFELKKTEQNLVKLERYVEAYQIQTKCNYLEKIEAEKFLKERNELIQTKADQVVYKQSLEKNALKQKLDFEYETMKTQRDEEISALILKYNNKKADLEKAQKQQKFLASNENCLRAKNTAIKISNAMKQSAAQQRVNHPSPILLTKDMINRDYQSQPSLQTKNHLETKVETQIENIHPNEIEMKNEYDTQTENTEIDMKNRYEAKTENINPKKIEMKKEYEAQTESVHPNKIETKNEYEAQTENMHPNKIEMKNESQTESLHPNEIEMKNEYETPEDHLEEEENKIENSENLKQEELYQKYFQAPIGNEEEDRDGDGDGGDDQMLS